MKVVDILKSVYATVEGDVDYPGFEDSDIQLYFFHLKDSLKEWVKRFPKSRETLDYLENATDGDKQTSSGKKTYLTPKNFVKHQEYIYIGDRKLTYLSPEKIELDEYKNGDYFSVIGFPESYKIVISFIPDGASPIDYQYHRSLNVPVDEDSIVEISRPDFCTYFILWKLSLEDDPDLVVYYEGKMNEEESNEKIGLVVEQSGNMNKGFNNYNSGFGQRTN